MPLEMLARPFDPQVDSLPEWEGRMMRAVSVLDLRGVSVDEVRAQRTIIQSRYAADTAGMEPREVTRYLRGCLARILDGEGDGLPDSDVRPEVLVELLRNSMGGGAPNELVLRMITGSGSAGAGSTSGGTGVGRKRPAPYAGLGPGSEESEARAM